MFFSNLRMAMDKYGLNEDYFAEEIIRKGNNIYKYSEYIGHKELTKMTLEDELLFARPNGLLKRKEFLFLLHVS